MDVNELNKINAQILKAKLRGDNDKVKQLEEKLKLFKSQTSENNSSINDNNITQHEENEEKKPDEEILHKIAPLDSKGRLLTTLLSTDEPSVAHEDMRRGSKRGIKKGGINDIEIDYTKRQKIHDTDIDSIYQKNILKMGSRYKESHNSRSGRDEDDEIDMTAYIDKTDHMTEAKKREYELKEAIKADKKWTSILNSCSYCFDNPNRPKQMLIAIGNYTYLTLPLNLRVTPFHCQIVPINHVWSVVEADEEVVQEIEKFKAALTRMAKHMHMGCIYMEEARGSVGRRHCIVDCIPVPKEVEQDAPLFFRKSLQETDDEWQASNRKLMDTTKKGIRRSIPKGFPYFHVQWSNITGPEGGFAHVIEDETQFPTFFGYDILCGMMGLQPIRMNREHNTPEQEKELVHNFLKKWKHYDWTRELDGGNY